MTDELDFARIKSLLADYAKTNKAKENIMKKQAANNPAYVEQLLIETQQAIAVIETGQHMPFVDSEAIDPILLKAQKGLLLSADELEKVADYLRVMTLLKRFFKRLESEAPLLSSYVQSLIELPKLEEAIYDSIEHGIVADRADRDLARLRKQLTQDQTAIREGLNHFLTNKKYKTMIQDPLIVEKNGVLTIPMKANYKNQLNGQIVASSSGGKTVYWQPSKMVNLNAEIATLKMQITNIEYAILGALTAQVFENSRDINENIAAITAIDEIMARARYSQSYDGKKPVLNHENSLELNAVRHPLLVNPVPLTVKLDQERAVLMITGPNAGGKTVALKTIGLMVLMTELGLFLPSQKPCKIPVMDQVCTLIGDHQSIDNSLSTFSAEMKQIADIISGATARSLILLDELGTGTDPNEGSAIAIGVLQELYLRGCLIVATTHYSAIKDFALKHEAFMTAEMDFDPATLSPTYRLILNRVGDSRALWIAKKVGLSDRVLHLAENYLERDEFPLAHKQVKLKEKPAAKQKPKLVLHKGDVVYISSIKKEGIFHSLDGQQAKVFVDKKFDLYPVRRLQLRRLAKDLYPEGYNLDLLFVENWQDYKFDKDLARGSKKAYKKLRKIEKSQDQTMN
ncbi:DNA mismatch repair protein [Lactobacillus pasteurii DSM 23907 = CRBIP 24.76]|uniref:MutS domain V n=1 Tax=Lactobacillus pasteurii DSM 23907 = CRBIP 24.76 TaxID=1423790 RepID=I7LBF0_9LACO|nr:MutS domain V [Lactobacillus pasteurii]KRK07761.1 DNA mismatch repair protein [Lactobacillus pasteurii DSM 23907 = CRBIP 24.76]TDG77517.1 hypothetical protein C5L33_000960 [Lactobacillus pasteurii]CCI85521.1 MutS domain V [Lactobacillus pasteurii DSM 23907 = CRBIP 24.76]